MRLAVSALKVDKKVRDEMTSRVLKPLDGWPLELSSIWTAVIRSASVRFFWHPASSPVMNRYNICRLVGGLEHFLFFHILGIIIPTD